MDIGIIVAAVLIGVLIGVFSGLLGIGGGTVMVPAFRVLFGMSAVASTATSLFAIIPTSISGAVAHVRNRTSIPKLGLCMGIGGACTSPIGVLLAQHSPGWAVMLGAALAIGYSSVSMLLKAIKMGRPAGSAAQSPASAGQAGGNAAATMPPMVEMRAPDLLKGVAIGVVAGVISGYVGLGGGFLMMPLMLQLLRIPMKLASGTSLVAVLILAIPGAALQFYLGNVELVAGIAIVCGAIPGAFVGARLVSRIPERALRFLFAAFLLVAAVLLVLKETGLL